MIETIRIRKCDFCGKEMSQEHVQIKWPDGTATDVCHDCTRELNIFLRNMRNKNEVNECPNSIWVTSTST